MIKIILDKNEDKKTFLNFYNMQFSGIDFGASIKADYPDINKENYNEYIDNFYSKNKEILERFLFETNAELNKNQDRFFSLCKKIFNKNYSGEEYVGKLSIFNSNPRYPDTKTFQIYYKRSLKWKMMAIYHEVLHFMFFDFGDSNITGLKERETDSGPYWDLSEIFNDIILNSPEFQNSLDIEKQMPYPVHEDLLPEFEKLWSDYNHSIKEFIETGIMVLETRPYLTK